MTHDDERPFDPLGILSDPKKTRRFMVCAAVAVVGVWAIYWVAAAYWPNGPRAGVFGDTFGALNALFSGLAMLGVLFAVIMQHQELEITKREAKESEQSRKESEKALARQAELSLASARLVAANSISNSRNDVKQYKVAVATAGQRVDEKHMKEIEKNIQYMLIILNDINTPEFAWGPGVAPDDRTAVRKYMVALAREARRNRVLPAAFKTYYAHTGVNDLSALRLELEWVESQDTATEGEKGLARRFAGRAASLDKEADNQCDHINRAVEKKQRDLGSAMGYSEANKAKIHQMREEADRIIELSMRGFEPRVASLVDALESELLGLKEHPPAAPE